MVSQPCEMRRLAFHSPPAVAWAVPNSVPNSRIRQTRYVLTHQSPGPGCITRSRCAQLPVSCVDPSQTHLTNQQCGGHILHHSPGITVGAAGLDPTPAPLGCHDPDPGCEPVKLKLERPSRAASHELEIGPGRLECPAGWLLLIKRDGSSPGSLKSMVVPGVWLYVGCLPCETYEVSWAPLCIYAHGPVPQSVTMKLCCRGACTGVGGTRNKQDSRTFPRGRAGKTTTRNSKCGKDWPKADSTGRVVREGFLEAVTWVVRSKPYGDGNVSIRKKRIPGRRCRRSQGPAMGGSSGAEAWAGPRGWGREPTDR